MYCILRKNSQEKRLIGDKILRFIHVVDNKFAQVYQRLIDIYETCCINVCRYMLLRFVSVMPCTYVHAFMRRPSTDNEVNKRERKRDTLVS